MSRKYGAAEVQWTSILRALTTPFDPTFAWVSEICQTLVLSSLCHRDANICCVQCDKPMSLDASNPDARAPCVAIAILPANGEPIGTVLCWRCVRAMGVGEEEHDVHKITINQIISVVKEVLDHVNNGPTTIISVSEVEHSPFQPVNKEKLH